MASKQEFVSYVADQISGAGKITCRKMFGEYGVYCDGKLIGLICDNQFFVKITEAGKRLSPEPEKAPPYEGAKPYYLIEDVDDREAAAAFVAATCAELPPPKEKPKKSGREKHGI